LKEIISLTVKLKNLNAFSKGIELLADVYISNRDFSNGIYCYNLLRGLSDATLNTKLKVRVLLELATICRILLKF
jgi:hypothetical protein